MKILSGTKTATIISNDLENKIKQINYKPRLVIIQVGDNPASNKYVEFKMKKAQAIGAEAINKKYNPDFPENELIEDIKELAPWVDGIIVQLPLPKHYDTQKILNSVPFEKDIDGLAEGNKLFTPATPRGIMSLLKMNDIEIKDKVVAVIGRSKLVGFPVANLVEAKKPKELIRLNSQTGLKGAERADILIVAVGKLGLIKKENIKEGAVIIDVGTNVNEHGKLVGDVDIESVGNKPSAISPVPGGVGPMTVISLFQNLLDAIKKD